MSTLTVKNLQGVSPTNQVNIPAGHKLYAPGHILQVVYARSNAKASTTSTSPVAIDSTLNLTLIPTSTTSKIFVCYYVMVSGSSSAYNNYAYIYRNSGVQLTYSNCYRCDYQNNIETIRTNLFYLDSPATTSSTTYNLYLSVTSGATLTYNYSTGDNGDWGYSYGYAMEVAQ